MDGKRAIKNTEFCTKESKERQKLMEQVKMETIWFCVR